MRSYKLTIGSRAAKELSTLPAVVAQLICGPEMTQMYADKTSDSEATNNLKIQSPSGRPFKQLNPSDLGASEKRRPPVSRLSLKRPAVATPRGVFCLGGAVCLAAVKRSWASAAEPYTSRQVCKEPKKNLIRWRAVKP